MHHRIVRRIAAGLAIVLLAAAGLFAWIVAPGSQDAPAPAADGDGRALFETHCASCHAVEDLHPGPEPLSGARWLELESFLEDHGDAAAAEDRLILEFLYGKYPPPRH